MEISRTLLLAGAAFIIAGGLVFGIVNRIYKNKITKIEESYTAQILEVNKEAIAAKEHADSVDFMYARHKLEMDSISKIEAKLRWENEQFKVELTNAWHLIFDATEDENYTSLQIKYPSEDTLKYPFSGEQVKGIALDLVKLDYKDSLYNNQLKIAEALEIQLAKSNHMVDQLNVERQGLEFINSELRIEAAARIEELGLSKEENAMLRKRVRRIGAGGAGVGLGLLALLLLL
jgi:hypothetical protein